MHVDTDVAIPGDKSVIKKETEKFSLKYKGLKTEIQRMWNVKAKVKSSNKWGEWNHFKIT